MPTTELSTKRKWTYQDYLKLGDEEYHEIIAGEMIMAPAPYLNHQEISMNLVLLLGNYVRNHNLGKVYHTPTDIILDDENVVQPDILFIANENSGVMQKRGIFGPPDLVIEIISPTSIQRDRHEKKELYQRFKVKEYWLVDPANQSIEVFTLENNKYKLSSFSAEKRKVNSKVIKEFEVEVSEIFS